MSDIRLKEIPFEHNGKTYLLRCNFNVLADLQEEFGEIPDVMDGKKSMRNMAAFIAAMMNDYADAQNWPERFTARQVGRILPANPDIEMMQNIMKIVVNALYLQQENTEEQAEGDGEKN